MADETKKDGSTPAKAADAEKAKEASTGSGATKPEGTAKTDAGGDTAKPDGVTAGAKDPDGKPADDSKAPSEGDAKSSDAKPGDTASAPGPKPELTDAQKAALDRDGDGKPGGSLSDAELEKIKAEAFNAGYEKRMAEEREDAENAPEVPEAADIFPTDGNEKYVAAALLAVVLRLPRTLRVGGLRMRLDELSDFINGYDGDDRYLAAELVKAIAEVRPEDISSGQFKYDVENAIKLLNGEEEKHTLARDQAAEQRAAHARLAKVAKSNPVPSGFNKAPAEGEGAPPNPDPVLDGSEAQNAAASRLYTDGGHE